MRSVRKLNASLYSKKTGYEKVISSKEVGKLINMEAAMSLKSFQESIYYLKMKKCRMLQQERTIFQLC